MYRALLSNPTIENYLRAFPKPHWDKCVELTLTLGIQSALQLVPYSLSLDSLARAVDQQTRWSKPIDLETALQPEKGKTPLVSVRSQPDLTDRDKLQPARKASEKPLANEPKASSRHRHKEDVRRFFSPQKVYSERGEDGSDSRVKASEVGRKHASPSPSDSPRHEGGSRLGAKIGAGREKQMRSSPTSVNSSILVEPRTNAAFLDKLIDHYEKPESSILRITDRFLSDPFLTTLSNRSSPRSARK